MNRLFFLLALGLSILAGPFNAAQAARALTPAEASGLRAEVEQIAQALDRFDAEPLIRRSHNSIQVMTGEAFANTTRQYVAGLKESGLKVLSAETALPSELHVAGNEEVVFVPRTSVLELKGNRARSQTFFIAVRRIGEQQWSFLDGTNLRKHPEMLYQLLPSLNPFITRPPNQVEELR